MMKIKDIMDQHAEVVNMAENLRAEYPEDIAQNIWVKLLETEEREGNIDKYDFEGKLDYNKTKNIVIAQIQKERRIMNTLDVDEMSDTLGDEIFADEREPALEEAMLSLSEHDKALFYRYAVNEDTQKEISDDLGVSQQLVSRQIEKIKKILQQKMRLFSKNI